MKIHYLTPNTYSKKRSNYNFSSNRATFYTENRSKFIQKKVRSNSNNLPIQILCFISLACFCYLFGQNFFLSTNAVADASSVKEVQVFTNYRELESTNKGVSKNNLEEINTTFSSSSQKLDPTSR